MLPNVLTAIDRTQDEGLRFQLWESACTMVLGAVADAASSRLRDPDKYYGPGRGGPAPDPFAYGDEFISNEDIGSYFQPLRQTSATKGLPLPEGGWMDYNKFTDSFDPVELAEPGNIVQFEKSPAETITKTVVPNALERKGPSG